MGNKFCEKLKMLRKEKGVFQKDIATFLYVSNSAYANYEQGRNEPSIAMLIKIAQFFGVTTDYLLGLEDF